MYILWQDIRFALRRLFRSFRLSLAALAIIRNSNGCLAPREVRAAGFIVPLGVLEWFDC